MANPNPSRIADVLWRVWEVAVTIIAGVRLGGIYANKSGYHNTVNANKAGWPGNYSIRFFLDLMRGPADKARAIDLTMGDALMRLFTGRLVAAADRNDPRMRPVREFYGTTNSRTVVGRIRDNDTSSYRGASSDSSHLWHIHIGFWAAYCADWAAVSGVLSVLAGESLAEWEARGGSNLSVPVPSGSPVLRTGSTGTPVRQLQAALNEAVSAGLTADGDFGPATEAAVKAFQRQVGLDDDGIYGPATAAALREELSDMPLSDADLGKIRSTLLPLVQFEVDETVWAGQGTGRIDHGKYSVGTGARNGWAYGKVVLAELKAATAAQRKRDEAILAGITGLDTAAILARIDQRAAEDAQRDAALTELVDGALSGERDAAEVLTLIAQILSQAAAEGEPATP